MEPQDDTIAKNGKVNDTYYFLLDMGKIKNKKEFAALLDVDYIGLTKAMKGNTQYLTDSLVSKVAALKEAIAQGRVDEQPQEVLVPLLPTSARAGTLADFAQTVTEYDCERIISPVKGADYAIQVTGDSMAPEYEPGCQVLIKKIFEDQFVEWGKTYVLDTMNGSVIKKIFPTEDPAVIECRSVNPQYPPFRVKCEHIHGWYRVLMILALK